MRLILAESPWRRLRPLTPFLSKCVQSPLTLRFQLSHLLFFSPLSPARFLHRLLLLSHSVQISQPLSLLCMSTCIHSFPLFFTYFLLRLDAFCLVYVFVSSPFASPLSSFPFPRPPCLCIFHYLSAFLGYFLLFTEPGGPLFLFFFFLSSCIRVAFFCCSKSLVLAFVRFSHEVKYRRIDTAHQISNLSNVFSSNCVMRECLNQYSHAKTKSFESRISQIVCSLAFPSPFLKTISSHPRVRNELF